jgi:hypothetical protein
MEGRAVAYQVRVAPLVRRRLAKAGLPEEVFMEVHLRLTDVLPKDPLSLLVRVNWPFDGLVYTFSMVEPGNRFVEHRVTFHVFLNELHDTLNVEDVALFRLFGGT